MLKLDYDGSGVSYSAHTDFFLLPSFNILIGIIIYIYILS